MRQERAQLVSRIAGMPPRSIRRMVQELRLADLTRRLLEQEAVRPIEPDEGEELKWFQR
ncbi:hypothetical protein SAMN02983003_3154 [Devosia enhydra]|uniref:Uncharacterized protein n=2 Tax=Devosia enhydra TaxID=665118 RepID=A0A1K2I0T1_9HYPH|nr:hypothetical protein SAMN02983003_3154 [Devosia enhydra]